MYLFAKEGNLEGKIFEIQKVENTVKNCKK